MNAIRNMLFAACMAAFAFQACATAQECGCGDHSNTRAGQSNARMSERNITPGPSDVPAGDYSVSADEDNDTAADRWTAFNRDDWRTYTSYRYYSTQDYGNQFRGDELGPRSVAYGNIPHSDYVPVREVSPVYSSPAYPLYSSPSYSYGPAYSYRPAARTWTYARPSWSDPNYVYTTLRSQDTDMNAIEYDDADRDARVYIGSNPRRPRVNTRTYVEVGPDNVDVNAPADLDTEPVPVTPTNDIEPENTDVGTETDLGNRSSDSGIERRTEIGRGADTAGTGTRTYIVDESDNIDVTTDDELRAGNTGAGARPYIFSTPQDQLGWDRFTTSGGGGGGGGGSNSPSHYTPTRTPLGSNVGGAYGAVPRSARRGRNW